MTKIVDDVKRLTENGVRELTLIGQNVNAYHGEGPDGKSWPLGRLLEHLAALPGVARLRYSTSHPRDVDDSLIAAHRDLHALMPFVHLPVQSGSDRILAAMNRKHTADDYRRVVDRFRSARQDIAFSSDFIVGFPGERARFSRDPRACHANRLRCGIFVQILRPAGNAGRGHAGDGVPSEMDQRLERLQELIDSQQSAFNKAAIGSTVDVLFERPARRTARSSAAPPSSSPRM